jgi:hypothetical protein
MQRKAQARAAYWSARGYYFDPTFMTAELMDMKVKDVDRARYWAARGYKFDSSIMTAELMNMKMKDVDRARYWATQGYQFDSSIMTAALMDMKVNDINRAKYWAARGYKFDASIMTSELMDMKVKDVDRARYWALRGYHFDPEIMTSELMDAEVRQMAPSNPPQATGDDVPVSTPAVASYAPPRAQPAFPQSAQGSPSSAAVLDLGPSTYEARPSPSRPPVPTGVPIQPVPTAPTPNLTATFLAPIAKPTDAPLAHYGPQNAPAVQSN